MTNSETREVVYYIFVREPYPVCPLFPKEKFIFVILVSALKSFALFYSHFGGPGFYWNKGWLTVTWAMLTSSVRKSGFCEELGYSQTSSLHHFACRVGQCNAAHFSLQRIYCNRQFFNSKYFCPASVCVIVIRVTKVQVGKYIHPPPQLNIKLTQIFFVIRFTRYRSFYSCLTRKL